LRHPARIDLKNRKNINESEPLPMKIPSLVSLTFLMIASALPNPAKAQTPKQLFGPELADFVQTSASGDHFKALSPVKFLKGPASNGIVVTVTPTATRRPSCWRTSPRKNAA
jgi:hypothetical protein